MSTSGAGTDEIDDDVLLAALGHVLSVDEPFPFDALVAIENEAFSAGRVDHELDELAELLFDSAAEPEIAVRGDGPRALSYVSSGCELDVELQPDGTVIGRVAPVGTELAIEGPTGPAQLETDDLGRFIAAAPLGRLRFVLRVDAPTVRVVTPWIFH